jgi:hypothetical protein
VSSKKEVRVAETNSTAAEGLEHKLIHVHGERSDGSRVGVMDLAGTLQDGRIDAKGRFLNGRSVTLNWRRN